MKMTKLMFCGALLMAAATAQALVKQWPANGAGGGGTVTSVSCSNLSPMFTCTVNNSTSTASIVFALDNIAANAFCGGPTAGSPAALACRQLVVADIPVGYPDSSLLVTGSQLGATYQSQLNSTLASYATTLSGTTSQVSITYGVGTAVASLPSFVSIYQSATNLPTQVTGSVLQLEGAAATQAFLDFDCFGAPCTYLSRRADGTAASPTAVQTGEVIGGFTARGYGATAYSAAARASVQLLAGNNWTDANQGAGITFTTTPTGGVSTAEAARFAPSGDMLIGTTTDSSTGGLLQVNGNAIATNFTSKATNVSSAGATTTLTAASTRLQNLTGSSAQTFQLPDATTLTIGTTFRFNNNSTGVLSVVDNGSNAIATVPAGASTDISAIAVATSNGSWDSHSLLPSAATWGTAGVTSGTFKLAGSSSGSTVIQPAAAASGTLTAPATTDTLAVLGAQTFTGLQTLTAGLTLTGATQVNVNTANNTLIGTGTATGTVQLGGTGTQAITIGTGNGAKTVTIGSTNASATLALQGPAGGISFVGLSTGTNADTVCLSAGGVVLIQAAACTISMRKLKENIEPFDFDPLAELMQLQPVQFNMKPTVPANPDLNATHTQLGQVAEDVAAVDPRLALYNPDGTPKSYRETAMISLLIASVQEQQKEINELKAQLRRTSRRSSVKVSPGYGVCFDTNPPSCYP